MKKVPGMMNAGELTLAINLIPKDPTHDGSTGFIALLGLNYTTGFALVYPDAGVGTESQWYLDGHVSGWGGDSPVDGILASNITISLDGKPVFVEGT